MSKQYPRVRDVRERLLSMYEVMSKYFDAYAEDFDRPFMKEVRDLLREGTDLETAVIVAGDFLDGALEGGPLDVEIIPEPGTVLSLTELEALRAALEAAAGLPVEFDPDAELPYDIEDDRY